MVIADDTADPALVACDLLGQAEHDPNSGVAEISWRNNGRIVLAEGPEEAVALSVSAAGEERAARFGVRRVTARGEKLLLNGEPFCVRGFGCDGDRNGGLYRQVETPRVGVWVICEIEVAAPARGPRDGLVFEVEAPHGSGGLVNRWSARAVFDARAAGPCNSCFAVTAAGPNVIMKAGWPPMRCGEHGEYMLKRLCLASLFLWCLSCALASGETSDQAMAQPHITSLNVGYGRLVRPQA